MCRCQNDVADRCAVYCSVFEFDAPAFQLGNVEDVIQKALKNIFELLITKDCIILPVPLGKPNPVLGTKPGDGVERSAYF